MTETLPRDKDGKLMQYAFPGGYPIVYFDGDESLLCPDCARRCDEDPNELPSFKPQRAVLLEDAESRQWCRCESCDRPIEDRED